MASQSGGGDSPKPSTSALIKDGAVSGVLPACEAFAVHFPGYPSSPSRAVQALGGLSEIAKVRSSESGNLELRFRPEDPYCHPAFGELRPSASLLLRISKTKNDLSAEVMARVKHAYQFEGLVDYQHVLGVHAAEARIKKRPWDSIDATNSGKNGSVEMDGADIMMLVPPLFTSKDRPEKIVLNPSANLFSKNIQRGVVMHRWEMDIDECLAIPIPTKINWEENIPRDTTEWEWQVAVCKLFEEQPIWPRRSLHEHLLDDGMQVSENQLKRLLFRAGYYFSTGPFGRFWIRKGYDPRKDPDSRIFQKVDFRVPPQLRNLDHVASRSKQRWKDICQFQVIPSKSFVCLQLFEVVDDFIQEEIRKPSKQRNCLVGNKNLEVACCRKVSVSVSYWFCERLVKVLLERSKKEAAVSKFQKLEEEEQQIISDNVGESIPNDYLQELLRGFPLDREGKNSQFTHLFNGADASDDEYKIYEQDSDDSETLL
ncbi:General transcription factor 3C polypeptide 5 [Ananas comosus]|uniref:General transcription factor 3C polypeptide 5 n=1 Tax=Ananas comosus TaxID=4615 RepID=A0A199VT56_ANACO|nr:General transcription factor 3C polypeptide 5 [Ananas comosus]